MFKLLTTLSIITLFSTPILAQSYIESLSGNQQIALNNFHHELVECAAFYQVSAIGMEMREDKESLELADRLSTVVYRLFVEANELHRTDITLARFEMGLTTMMDEMHNNFVNFSILLNKYSSLCKTVVDHPGERIQYYLQKQNNKD